MGQWLDIVCILRPDTQLQGSRRWYSGVMGLGHCPGVNHALSKTKGDNVVVQTQVCAKEKKMLELNQCNMLQFSIVLRRMFVVNSTLWIIKIFLSNLACGLYLYTECETVSWCRQSYQTDIASSKCPVVWHSTELV